MKVLGYNGGFDGYPSKFDTGHDSAAALVIDGKLVAACEEERFTRDKHTNAFPRNAIEYCLREGGMRDVAEARFDCVQLLVPADVPPGEVHRQSRGAAFSRAPGQLARRARDEGLQPRCGLQQRPHASHLRAQDGQHARSGALRRGAASLVPRGQRVLRIAVRPGALRDARRRGESASGMVVVASGTDFKVVRQAYAPNSLGYLYAFVTRYLGFDTHDEYKVMGLAPYGDPTAYRQFFKSVVTHRADGTFWVDPSLIFWLQVADGVGLAQRGVYPPSMIRGLGPARRKSEPVLQRHMDIAASLQEALENVVIQMLTTLKHETNEKNLCLAGGVALNCTMNGKIARSGLFDDVWIHPAAHDSGTSVGAAWYGYHNLLKQPRNPTRVVNPYLGPSHPPEALESALKEFSGKIKHSRPGDLYGEVAQAIAAGKVVGFYHGKMEWGPRALGNRSILADARRDDMKDVVNHAVKLREGFRPFAPACLAEHADEWFDMTGLSESPYMLFIVPVRQDKRAKIPAVTHVDGSGRLQTVTAAQNEPFYKVLSAFHKLTGVPVMMNTSFNVKGEPIVNTPSDAVRCFLNTQIDLLVLEDVLIEKRPEVATALAKERSHLKGQTGRVVDGQISMV